MALGLFWLCLAVFTGGKPGIRLRPSMIHDLLLKRFATKSFDTSKKVSDEHLQQILEAARLSPSSGNTQPWKIIVVTNPALREGLKSHAYGQAQVTEASHLLVVCAVKDVMPRIQETAALIRTQSGDQAADGYVKMVTGWIPETPQETHEWLSCQTYVALQSMILAAAELGIDSCPMEGFEPVEFAEALGLTDVIPVTLLPIGYAASPGHPKVRIALDSMVEYRV